MPKHSQRNKLITKFEPSSRNGDHNPSQAPSRWVSLTGQAVRPLIILILTAAISSISQLTLAAVYGSIPSAVNHQQTIVLTFLAGLMLDIFVFTDTSTRRIYGYLGFWPFWVPVVQYLLLPYSATLGPIAGPISNDVLACHAILIPSTYALVKASREFGLAQGRPVFFQPRISLGVGNFMRGGFLLMFFRVLDTKTVPWALSKTRFLTPIHLQVLLASSYACLFPSWLSFLAVPALLHTALFNAHFNTGVLQSSIQSHNWTLVDRQWSESGYVSILDSLEQEYRVMRCDHSLLGGEWLLTDSRKNNEGWLVNEPIYAVFEMLEALRLLELDPPIPDSEAQALIIGLGIGTAPKAFIAHGIATTVVEFDPVVYDFATKYFNLPSNHTAVIQDAVSWVNSTAQEDRVKYDYIIHDVFTGGAEPLALFNAAFLSRLRSLLKQNGVIAINYAGDLSLPLTKLILHTINTVFAEQCRAFRDAPPGKHVSSASRDRNSAQAPGGEQPQDFLNIILFCRNTPGPLTFRAPKSADFLGSKSRQHYMLPNPEYELSIPTSQDVRLLLGNKRSGRGQSGSSSVNLLNLGDERRFKSQQIASAMRHWYIMRDVLPNAVWELW